MKELLWSIDFDDYSYEDNDTYAVEGWAFARGGEMVDVQILGNGGPVAFSCKWKPRPDLKEVLKEEAIPENPGFRIEIPGISQLLEAKSGIHIRLVTGKETTEIAVRPETEIRSLCADKMLSYKIDVKEIQGKDLVVQGWFIDQYRDDIIEVQDENGGTLRTEIYRVARPDVNEVFRPEDLKYRSGFNLKVPLGRISTRHITVIFRNRIASKKKEIDVKKLIFDSSERGRLWNALKPERWGENLKVIRRHGLPEFVRSVRKEVTPQYSDYNAWIRARQLKKKQIISQRDEAAALAFRPKISIVIPLYNTPLNYLRDMVDSIQSQTYDNWQLCLADGSSQDAPGELLRRRYGKDQRIVYQKLKENGGISANTNEALKMADGDFILLADHDDLLVQGALFEIVKALNEHPETEIVYTDEDKISMNGRLFFGPNFKPDFSWDLLRSVNYICHIFVVKSEIVKKAGWFRSEYDGAQDYDFILRCCEQTEHIVHIPRVLYHWRAHPDSTAENPESKRYAYDAGRKAVEAHYQRTGLEATVEDTEYYGIYRSRFAIKGNPLISILILNKDHVKDLRKCVESILEKSAYRNFEIIIAENNSEEEETFQYYEYLKKTYPCVKVCVWKGEFNFSAINNFAAGYASGEYFLLLNNDIEVISPSWLEEMLGYCQRPDVGIVGAKLYYPDDTIQHAGVVIGMGGIAGHILCRANGNEAGYNGRLVTVQDMSAVTAACMMVKKEVFQAVGGLDETYRVAFNDIDFCMKVRAMGKLIVFTPFAELYHYESKSRGMEDTPEKQMRFAGEIRRFQKKWQKELDQGDPYYNPNLSLEEGDCSLKEG